MFLVVIFIIIFFSSSSSSGGGGGDGGGVRGGDGGARTELQRLQLDGVSSRSGAGLIGAPTGTAAFKFSFYCLKNRVVFRTTFAS